MIVSYTGEVIVIDFGIARAITRLSKTPSGMLKGKIAYMSPEQVAGQAVDRRSDIFALGTLLYEMLVGAPLFVGENDVAILENVRQAQVISPREQKPEIPAQLEQIVLKALAKTPDERYQSACDVKTDLSGVCGSPSSGKHFTAQRAARPNTGSSCLLRKNSARKRT